MEEIKEREFKEKATYIKHTVLNHPQIKEWFLEDLKSTYNETDNYGIIAENLMYKVSSYEINFMQEKDFCEFTQSEMMDAFASFRSISVSVLSVYRSILKSYVDFCIEKGHVKNGINFLDNIDINQLSNLIDKGKINNRNIKRNDFYTLIEQKLVNNQDRAMMSLIFEGVKGKDNIDIINLKNEDLNPQNSTITITEKKNEKGEVISKGKIINVPRRCMNILQLATMDTDYRIMNGNANSKYDPIQPLVSISESPYLLRPLKMRGGIQLTGQIVQTRALRFLKFDLDLPYVTVVSLYRSGLIDKLMEYTEKHNENKIMTTYDIQKYIEQFDEKANIIDLYNAYKEAYLEK